MVEIRREELFLAGPWPRFWARIVDILLYAFPISFLLVLAFPSLLELGGDNSRVADLVISLVTLPIALALDALILSFAGTSPGKAITGLLLTRLEGGRVPIGTSLMRNGLLYLQGLVLGLPILFLFGLVNAHRAVKESGTSSWDDDTDTRVYAVASSSWRTWLTAILAVALYVASAALNRL